MKVTLTVRKEEVDALRYTTFAHTLYSKMLRRLLGKIEKQIAYNKKKEAYDKQVKDVMGDTIEKIENHRFVIEDM